MDSDCPAASRIAGQTSVASGVSFTANGFTFKRESTTGRRAATLGARSLRSSRRRPYYRSADGDGR